MQETVSNVLSSQGLEADLISEFLTVGRLKKANQGDPINNASNNTMEMPIVLSGLLKVMRRDKDGREVFLYFLEGGETCAMSITCCIDGKKQAIYVEAVEDSTLWMVPMAQMDDWIVKYPAFRRYVFLSYQTRFDELLETIDSLTFSKLDQRLHKYLLDTQQATASFTIHKTHEQIAHELSTSRVVVSRLLKQLEREGKIEQERNRIVLL